jgi:hypothetical protein
MVARFAQGLAMQVRHLVRANHHGTRVLPGHGLGFGQGQAHGQIVWAFAGQWGLIHAG